MANTHTLETHDITGIVSASYDEATGQVSMVVETKQELQNPIQYVRLSPLQFRLLEVPQLAADEPAPTEESAPAPKTKKAKAEDEALITEANTNAQ